MATLRSDSWAAQLTPEQQAELYAKAKELKSWTQTVQWAVKKFKIKKEPSQATYYRWMETMRAEEQQQHLVEVAFASAEATALGKNTPSDETIIAAFKARALEAALSGNTKAAADLTRIADILHSHLMKEKALALAERRLKLIENEKSETMQKLREQAAAKTARVPFVHIFHTPDGLPPIRKATQDNESNADPNTSTDQDPSSCRGNDNGIYPTASNTNESPFNPVPN